MGVAWHGSRGFDEFRGLDIGIIFIVYDVQLLLCGFAVCRSRLREVAESESKQMCAVWQFV